jgi:putative transposase
VRRRDHAEIKADAQAIYRTASRAEAEHQAQAFARRWRAPYPRLVARLLQDLPELLAFFSCPRGLWRKLRTTHVIERCFVEIRGAPGRRSVS